MAAAAAIAWLMNGTVELAAPLLTSVERGPATGVSVPGGEDGREKSSGIVRTA